MTFRRSDGILLWALQGWLRLRQRGRFAQPGSVDEAVRDLEDLASPVGAFVRDQWIVGAGRAIEAKRLYEAWKKFCEEMGRDYPGTIQTFGRDLRAVVPDIDTQQVRTKEGRTRLYHGIDLAAGI